MKPHADRPPDGIVDVRLDGPSEGDLEIELRIHPSPPPGPRLEERVRAVGEVARSSLKATNRLFRPGFSESESASEEVEPEPRPPGSPRSRTGWCESVRTRREFYRFFEVVFRQLLGDVQREDRRLLRPGEQLHVGLRWWPSSDSPP